MTIYDDQAPESYASEDDFIQSEIARILASVTPDPAVVARALRYVDEHFNFGATDPFDFDDAPAPVNPIDRVERVDGNLITVRFGD